MTEQDKFINWLEREKLNGLKDINFFRTNAELNKDNLEEFFKEVNEIISAATVEDKELF